MTSELMSAIDCFTIFRCHLHLDGWVFHLTSEVTAVDIRLSDDRLIQTMGYGLPSPDVAFHHGEGGEHCRFAFDIAVDDVDTTAVCF